MREGRPAEIRVAAPEWIAREGESNRGLVAHARHAGCGGSGMSSQSAVRTRVVIVGGGFAGLNAARELANTAVDVVLVDRRNHHLFQPLLYQVATGSLSPADIASPLRHVLSRARNVRVVLGEVVDFDLDARRVVLSDGELAYDVLAIAAGSRPSYFGHAEWEENAPGLKALEDATRVRSAVLGAFERAEREVDEHARRALTTFAIVGAGPTGVELAGALAELARDTLRHDFRSLDPSEARIVLVEGADRVLGAFPDELSQRARESLERLGVEIWTSTFITDVAAGRLRVKKGSAESEIEAATILWAAGVRASPLAETLAERAGVELDKQGRIAVGADLALGGHRDVFVLGDMARCEQDGAPLPGVAPVAMQQGRYFARLVLARARGGELGAFRYRDKGNLAVIGRSAAVAEIRGRRFSGFTAWCLWLFVHLMYLVDFELRVLVFVQWAWSYFTRKRAARLITHEGARAR